MTAQLMTVRLAATPRESSFAETRRGCNFNGLSDPAASELDNDKFVLCALYTGKYISRLRSCYYHRE